VLLDLAHQTSGWTLNGVKNNNLLHPAFIWSVSKRESRSNETNSLSDYPCPMNSLRRLRPTSMAQKVIGWANPIPAGPGEPFNPNTSIKPPSGIRSSWVHYGVMVPDLPEPHRTFGIMAIVGTPGLQIFSNDHAIRTNPRDTAYVVSATGAMRAGQFNSYSIEEDCDLAPDGSQLRFGEDLLMEGAYPNFRILRRHPDFDVQLKLRATDKVADFFKIKGGLYNHWSLLCEYTGSVGDTAVSGLCTYEYAHGAGLHSLPHGLRVNVPSSFFTYHVLNLDDQTQLLFGRAIGPGGVTVIDSASLRSLDGINVNHRNIDFEVGSWAEQPGITAAGTPMRVPEELSWQIRDEKNRKLVHIKGRCNGDWAPGLGAGVVGSYSYEGEFGGSRISGTAYMEWVDLRTHG
jgi:hypothetical protein